MSGAQVVTSDGIGVTQHQGRLMPLVPVGDIAYDSKAEWPVLVVGVGGEPIGLLVSEIVDIVEDQLEIQIVGATAGIIGTANIRGEPTDILDVAHYMRLARPEAFERGHARRFHVLLVDDKQFFRDSVLAPVISAAGYEVSTVASGCDALALFNKGAVFDAVVTDIDMPEMDGYSLARRRFSKIHSAARCRFWRSMHMPRRPCAMPRKRPACAVPSASSIAPHWLRPLPQCSTPIAFNVNAIESRVIAEAAA